MISPFWCYFGGKWRAATKYPAPSHPIIIEPFAGAAGYATRYPHLQVILVEKDPTIAALWRYLIEATPEEILSLPAEVPSTVGDLDVCQEAKSLIGFWVNKGSARPCNTPSTWMKSNSSYWGVRARSKIAAQVNAIKHWQIIEGDYTLAPNIEGTWYIDPPYHDSGRIYKYGNKGIEFDRLGEWCKSRTGEIIVCEQQGADWLPFTPLGDIQASHGYKGKKKSKEVWWYRP